MVSGSGRPLLLLCHQVCNFSTGCCQLFLAELASSQFSVVGRHRARATFANPSGLEPYKRAVLQLLHLCGARRRSHAVDQMQLAFAGPLDGDHMFSSLSYLWKEIQSLSFHIQILKRPQVFSFLVFM